MNEAYLRLVGLQPRKVAKPRSSFLTSPRSLIRRILVDFARSRGYLKRGAGVHPLSLEKSPDIFQRTNPDLVALDDALKALAPSILKQPIIELRFFGD